jgi:hypothetical protein
MVSSTCGSFIGSSIGSSVDSIAGVVVVILAGDLCPLNLFEATPANTVTSGLYAAIMIKVTKLPHACVASSVRLTVNISTKVVFNDIQTLVLNSHGVAIPIA